MSYLKKIHRTMAMLVVPVCATYLDGIRVADAQEADPLQEIVVTGVRGSEQRSVALKRDAAIIQDSISAEDIGKLPDTSIAESKKCV